MYSNGKIYVGTDQQGNPIGISIYDVQQALGVGSPDLYTLYRSVKVNKWSKYKPIPMFGFWLTFEGATNECPTNPTPHVPADYNENLNKWYYGNMWGWDSYGLWRKNLTINGQSVCAYNIAGMWVVALEVNPRTAFEYDSQDDRNAHEYYPTGYIECDVFTSDTEAIVAALEAGIDANKQAYNYAKFLWSEVEALQAYSSLTFVQRLTDFNNYDHKMDMPLIYGYPLQLIYGGTASFSIRQNNDTLSWLDVVQATYGTNFARTNTLYVGFNVVAVCNGNAKVLGRFYQIHTGGTLVKSSFYQFDKGNLYWKRPNSDVLYANIDVAVNDLGNVGDTVKFYFFAILYSIENTGNLDANRVIPLPMKDGVMPFEYTIQSSASSVLRSLIAAGGNRWDLTLMNNGVMTIYGDDNATKLPEHNATFTVRLVNPTSAAVTVDLTQLQARWTWTGYYYLGWPDAPQEYAKQRTPHDAWRITINYYVNGTQIATPTAYQMAAGADITLECRLMQVWSSPLDDPYTVQNPTSALFEDVYMLAVQEHHKDLQTGDSFVYPEDFSTKYGSSPAEALDNILSIDVVHTENNETVKEHLANYVPRFTLHYTDDNPPA